MSRGTGSVPQVTTRPRMVGLWVALAVVALDQASKWWIVTQVMSLPRQIEILPVFNIVLVWNCGASFGLLGRDGPWARWLLMALALAIGIGLILWIARTHSVWIAGALGLVLGGAVGNLLDRLHHGAVVDFLDFHLGARHFPAFNVADSAITVGVILLLADALIARPRKA